MQAELHRRSRGITIVSYSVRMDERISIQESRLLARHEGFYSRDECIQASAIKDLSSSWVRRNKKKTAGGGGGGSRLGSPPRSYSVEGNSSISSILL